MSIHPTAIVDPSAILPPDAVVGPYSLIERDVCIGAGAVIGPHVVLHPHVSIGEHVRIHAGAVIGDTPQDLAFEPVVSHVQIGNHCTIREYVTIHRGTKEGTATTVGDHCYLMGCSHLAHNVTLGNRVILANGVLLAGYVDVGDGTFLGGGAAIHQFVSIGRLAMIGGLCGISKDVPPFCMTASVGYSRIAGLNLVGLKRAGIPPEQRSEIRRVFKTVFRSGLNIGQAVDQLRALSLKGPAAEFVEFVASSERGICSGGNTPGPGEDS